MVLPNSSEVVASGGTFATVLLNSVEYQVFIPADPDGHLVGSAPIYLAYFGPRVLLSSADTIGQWDLWNATGSGKVIRFRGIWPVLNQTAASAFVASFVFEIRRTSSIGSGGNTFTFESTSTPGAGGGNISRISLTDPTLPAQITARGVPSSGGANDDFWFTLTLFSEETNPASHQLQLVNWMPELPGNPPFDIPENSGVKLKQTSAIASTGLSIGWLFAFGLVP
jgi:hypothetical protein